jgi:hypothetical protein
MDRVIKLSMAKFDLDTSHVKKMAVFWVVAPCSLVEIYQHFRDPCCLHHQGSGHHHGDGGSKYLWNVGKLLPDYTVLQPRRQPSSYSPLWEPQILLLMLLRWFSSSSIMDSLLRWTSPTTAEELVSHLAVSSIFSYNHQTKLRRNRQPSPQDLTF